MAATSLFDQAPNDQILRDAHARVAENRAAFDAIERCAVERHRAGDWTGAIAHAAAAAHFASGAPCGVLASPTLERILLDVGRRLIPAPPPGAPRAGAAADRVLHVFTETYAIGGHTRLASRWIDLDRCREHSVFVSAPAEPAPEWLLDSVARSGGRTMLARRAASAVDRARQLRAVAAEADVVVLHAHMYDPVPMLAFADPGGRPPVILANHADHVLWLGVGVASVVVCFRRYAAELSARRRGIDPDRCRVLGVPLPADVPAPDRAAARERFGIDAERPVLVSIATEYKFATALAPAMQHLVVGALEAVPEAQLIVVGPEIDTAWTWAQQATGGRVHVLGRRTGTFDLLALADLYLDSWPCSSGTSLLEAALHGLPIVAWEPDPARQGALTLHLDSIEGLIVECATEAEYAGEIARLVADREGRLALGAATRAGIVDQHCGPGWADALEAVMAAAHAAGPAPEPAPLADAPVETWEALLDTLHRVGRILMPAEGALLAQGAGLEAWQRAQAKSTRRRAVAAPAPRATAVAAVVDGFRDLLARGAVSECLVVVEDDQLQATAELLEAALADGEDIEIDVLVLRGPEGLASVLRATDLCLAEAGTGVEAVAHRAGAEVLVLAAV